MTKKLAKSADRVAVERKERWQRYGRIGQARYGITALTGILEDTTVPGPIRLKAMYIRDDLNTLMQQYKDHLNVKS
jgi:uncharacterized protein (UPF0147 family)